MMLTGTSTIQRRKSLRVGLLLALAALTALLLGGCALDSRPPSLAAALPAAPALAQAAPAAQAGPAQALAAEPALPAPAAGEERAFAGTLDTLPDGGTWEGLWQVAGQAVRVGPSTKIDERRGKLQPGARVAIEGWQEEGGALKAGWVHVLDDRPAAAPGILTLTAPGKPASADQPSLLPGTSAVNASVALTLPTGTAAAAPVIKGSPSRWVTDTIHPVEYRGLVQMAPGEAMTGTWTIGGHTVNVGPGTDFKLQLGKLEEGAYVQVIGWLQPDGSIDASKILVKKLNPGQGKPGTAITTTLPFTSTTPGGVLPGDDGDDEPEDQADGNRHWDTHLHGTVSGVPITTTTGVSYTLTVNGQQVVVDENTWLKAQHELADGDWLQVKGLLQPDGTVLATSIQWVHRVPDGKGKPNDKGTGNAGPIVTTPAPGAGGKNDVKILPPGKGGSQVGPSQGNGNSGGQGKAPTRSAPAKPGKGNGNGNGNGNGHK